MNKVLNLPVLLALVLAFTACEKEPVQSKEKIEVSFAAKEYSVDFEGGLKAAMAPDGWPDIPYTSYLECGGNISIIDRNENHFVVEIGVGELNTATILLDYNDYFIARSNFLLPTYQDERIGGAGYYYANLVSFDAAQKFYRSDPGDATAGWDTIDAEHDILHMEFLPGHNCYAFKDPQNLIDSIIDPSAVLGLNRNEMAVIPPSGTVTDSVFYFYTSSDLIYVWLKGDTRASVDLAAYKNSLDPYPLAWFRRWNGPLYFTNIDLPFTSYVDFGDYIPPSTNINASFQVMTEWPFEEAIIDPS